MANLFPAAAPLNLQLNVDPILGNPTDTEIVREHNRFIKIEESQRRGAALNNENFAASIMRYNNVALDLGNTNGAIVNQLLAIQQEMHQGFEETGNRIEQLGNRIMQVESGIMQVESKMEANQARNFNNRHRLTPVHHGLPFHQVVKHRPGHPTAQPPAGVTRLDDPQQLVVFAQPQGGYPVGSHPPAGLVPQNCHQLSAMRQLTLVDLRRVLRGIYWFYNDPLLELAPHAGLGDTMARLDELVAFLTQA